MKNLFFKKKDALITYGGEYTYENERYIIAYEGELYLNNKRLACEELVCFLEKDGDIALIDGLYSLVVYSKSSEELTVSQDIISYFHPMYFSATASAFAVSISMRELIVQNEMKAEMEDSHIPEFLYNGFLTDDRCLIKGIKKVPAMHIMRYNFARGELRYQKRDYLPDEISHINSDYISLLEENIKSEIKSCSELNIALSSGFDSNLLLHIISSIAPEYKINAFCIGSSKGNDEVENVKKICEAYPQIKLSVCEVSPSILKSFPQMVYELEDSIFERGIFLQYMLAQALDTKSNFPVFLGEGADQLLSSEFSLDVSPYFFVGKKEHYPWVYYPYEMLSYIIIKKNGIFLRNRDIKAKYPFIRANFIDGVIKYRKLNGTGKEHYKKYVVESVRPEVSPMLVKRPGSTNLTSLFDEDNTEKIFRTAKSSRFYPMLTEQPDRDSGNEVDMDNCLKIIYLMLFERIFCSSQNSDSLKEDICDFDFEKLFY